MAVQILNRGNLPEVDASQTTLNTVLNIIFVIIGALAVLVIVIAGLRYVMSQGQPDKIAEIRKQILYAFAGLIVAASAAAIVNFVLGRA